MILSKIKTKLAESIGVFTSVFTFLIIAFVTAAQIRSCIPLEEGARVYPKLDIVPANIANKRHNSILARLSLIMAKIYPDTFKLEIYFARNNEEVNAISFGNGKFLIWESISKLPAHMIDSILAHEVSHDLLLHSKKQSDLNELKEFIVDMLGIHADSGTQKVMQNWSGQLVIPTYSRSQEYEADLKALKILEIIGHDRPKLIYIKMLSYLKSEYGESGGGFFKSHPSLSLRIKKLNDENDYR